MEQYEKYADKALSVFDTNYEKVMRASQDGVLEITIDKKKKKAMWSDFYFFTEQTYKEWKDYVIGDLKRKNPQLDGDSINVIFAQIDMVYGLSQPYLFIQQEQPTQVERNLPHTPDY